MGQGSAIVALLTDFGRRAPYVAEMKGVVLERCTATIIDLSHEIAPFDIFEAGWFLRAAAPYYPRSASSDARMIFVAVVDPGVGTARRIIAAEEDGRIFLAPDNGLLTLVLTRAATIHSVENEQLFLPGGSNTFHGRDRFAPVAAVLADGEPIGSVGPRLDFRDLIHFDYQPPLYDVHRAAGIVVAIDRFGNAITDLDAGRLFDLDRAVAHVGHHSIGRVHTTYGEAEGSLEPFLIVGSHGTVEISIANASAAERLQIARFDPVEIVSR